MEQVVPGRGGMVFLGIICERLFYVLDGLLVAWEQSVSLCAGVGRQHLCVSS